MLKRILLSALLLLNFTAFSQQISKEYYNKRKGKLFLTWGWNRDAFTKSDIHFKGTNYNFTIQKATARDYQKPFSKEFLDPTRLSIPQYNFRIGYFINDKYSISFGFDHMKYILNNGQTANVSGYINTGTKYDGTYNNTPTNIATDFVKLEHTNGLNYLNVELRRIDNITRLFKDRVELNVLTGVGIGGLYPKTDATILNFDRNDQWHLAGYGTAVVAGINVTILKNLFVQYEGKGGFINMPDIITTNYKDDRAKQDFFFFQRNISFGGTFRIGS